MHYKLHIYTGNNRAYITDLNLSVEEQEQMVDGKELSLSNIIVADIKNKTKEFPDIMGDSISKIIISSKVKTIFDVLPKQDRFQYFPIEINKKEYFLLNILNVIPCFDWEKSIFTTYSNPKIIRDINHLVFKPNEIKNLNIFRMVEKPYAVYVSEYLKDVFIKEKITGIKISDINFETDEDYKR